MMLSVILKKRATTGVALVRACSRQQSTFSGPNKELIQMLTQYMEEERASASSNSYKVRAYSKAISAIGQLSEQVRSVDQVRNLDGIGVRIAKRVDAYLCGTPYEPPINSGSRKTRNVDQSPSETQTKPQKSLDDLRRKQVVSSLSSISGIGLSKANALYDAGCRSLQDLREPEFFGTLSRAQQLCAQYMIGPKHRISRDQSSTICDFVTQNLSSKLTPLLSGDFRRGAVSAQQVTLVILHPHSTGIFPPGGPPSIDSTIRQRAKYHRIPSPFANHFETKIKSRVLPDTTTFSTEIISPLECKGLLVTTIAAGAQKWDGIIRFPKRTKDETEGDVWEARVERIRAVQQGDGQFFSAEIYYVPKECAGAALITLTGDLEFNLAMRRAASRRGLRLNEYGLWRWQGMATTSTDDMNQQESIQQHGGYWELVASEREEDIFEGVGMEWVAPERRNFANLDGRRKKQKGDE